MIQLLKKYRWAIAIVIFALYICFGNSSIADHRKLNKEIKRLEAELSLYKKEIATLKEQNTKLKIESQEDRESYLRTHQFLKKDNEDVFRIQSTNDSK